MRTTNVRKGRKTQTCAVDLTGEGNSAVASTIISGAQIVFGFIQSKLTGKWDREQVGKIQYVTHGCRPGVKPAAAAAL